MKVILICMAYLAMILTSCQSNMKGRQKDLQDVAINPPADATANTIIAQNITDTTLLQAGQPFTDWDKKLIKTADVRLELKDYNKYNQNLHTELKRYGAYIANEQQKQSDFELSNDITIKVPVDQFESFLNSLGGDGVKVLEKNITSQDVTGDIVDTKARMEAKKQVRQRYIDLLKQAKNMKEILDLQKEIDDIQENVEAANGRINYLTHSSSFSTVNLHYYQYLQEEVTPKEPGFLSNVTNAFKTGSVVIINLILFFISIWPLVLVAAFIIVYYKKIKVRKPHKLL